MWLFRVLSSGHSVNDVARRLYAINNVTAEVAERGGMPEPEIEAYAQRRISELEHEFDNLSDRELWKNHLQTFKRLREFKKLQNIKTV